MTVLLFGAAITMHLLAGLYYVRRFTEHRRPISLVISALCFGWSVAYARELHWIPLRLAAWVMYVGAVVAVFHLAAIQHVESQNPDPSWPFRWK